MIVEKKVVLCEKCRYFPIKAEHVGTQLLKIKQGSVVWKCKCCSNENANAFGGN